MKISLLVISFAVLIAGCGESVPEQAVTVIEETGAIEEGDPADENYGGYLYDSYDFPVEPLDVVSVVVESGDFSFLVTLLEVSTGAQLAEWDPEYSDETSLSYRIAGGGICQARVYALGGGTGTYTVRITVEGN